ncbi:hypothetical protein KY338_06195 [Candidatus Woesearchaeota archaeon]|nr:hypothetical protein [Candidatus Woesearchaeota archaeon]MBW3005405.1 hypothetical protein [Candidatus Woesearchaeota archaeon]
MEGDELKHLKAHIKKELKKGYSVDLIRSSLIDAGFSSREVRQAIEELKKKKIIKEPIKKPLFSGFFGGKPKKTKEIKPKEIMEEPPKPIIPIPKIPEIKTPKIKEVPVPEKKETKKAEPKPETKPAPVKIREEKPRRLWIFGFLAVLLIVVVVFGLAYVAPTQCNTEDCFISKANKCMAATFTNQIEGTTVYYETNNCALTKTIQALDPSEPQEIVGAFLGKSMTCKFNKNDFSPLFLNSITGYLEACEGPLKDKILEITRI